MSQYTYRHDITYTIITQNVTLYIETWHITYTTAILIVTLDFETWHITYTIITHYNTQFTLYIETWHVTHTIVSEKFTLYFETGHITYTTVKPTTMNLPVFNSSFYLNHKCKRNVNHAILQTFIAREKENGSIIKQNRTEALLFVISVHRYYYHTKRI